MQNDLNGRPYAQISKLKPGDLVQVDSEFTCIEANGIREVKLIPDAEAHAKRHGAFSDYYHLGIDCACGLHSLEAQIDFEGNQDSLIGVYPMEA